MLDICYEVFEDLKNDIENNDFIETKYLDTWDFEDEYSHNHIDENRDKFIDMANEYFKENNLPYVMREVCENAMICNNDFIETKYLDTWDFEDEYSHNHIDENRDKFIDMANEYFKENNLPYVMREVCENAMICNKDGEIIRRGE